ncbi:MAG: protease HtpX, partial [Panacagrimonas sp.]
MKRVFLLVATNIAVMLVLSVVASVLGVDRYLTQNGLNLGALLVFSALFGFGGAFISLAMSKWMAKRSTGAQVITEPRNAAEKWLVDTVQR